MRLIVEVADTSVADDLGPKRAAYATAGLPEYRVADLNAKTLHRHDAPAAGGYREAASVAFGGGAGSLVFGFEVETSALG